VTLKEFHYTILSDERKYLFMRERFKYAVRRTVQNPVLRKSAETLKPDRTLWGIAGVFFFFIFPEIVGFLWGEDLTAWAHKKMLIEATEAGRKMYWLIEKIFEDGGSYINLGIGLLLLLWLFWDWKNDHRKNLRC
jgi:hypothetical protein